MPLVALTACTATSADSAKSLDSDITTWAEAAGWNVTASAGCGRAEERDFGAASTTCWFAKQRTEQAPQGSRMFPRVTIVNATYADEARAKARMARFTSTPARVQGEMDKAYPLRAGFRIGAQVVVVTTDAFAFDRETKDTAIGLAKAIGGSDLVCWGGC